MIRMMDWMSLEGGGGIGVAAVATVRILLLLLVNHPLAGMMMILEEANLEDSPSPKQRIGTTIATWTMMMIKVIVVTHRTVLDHLEAGLGVIQTIPILPIRVVLGPDLGPDRCLWHLIRHHPPLQDEMIENIAVVIVVEDTVVEVGAAVVIEITTAGGDHHPMVVRGGATTVIIVIMGGVETIDEGGNRLIINARGRVLNRHIHLRTGEDVGGMEKIVVLIVAEGNYV